VDDLLSIGRVRMETSAGAEYRRSGYIDKPTERSL
jgi:hypothetical protein